MYRSLQIDVLEARALPSLAPGLAVPAVDPGGPMAAPQPVAGHITGGYSSILPPGIDAGVQFTFLGAGHVAHLGHVTMNGTINGVGSAQTGHATGTLTLTSSVNGSVTIEVTGPVQKFFSPMPHNFHYQVVGGTGNDANLHGSGTLTIKFASLDPPASGGFKMTLH